MILARARQECMSYQRFTTTRRYIFTSHVSTGRGEYLIATRMGGFEVGRSRFTRNDATCFNENDETSIKESSHRDSSTRAPLHVVLTLCPTLCYLNAREES